MRPSDSGIPAAWVIAGVFVLYLGVGCAVVGVLRSRDRRRDAERCALVRRQALARSAAGMPPGHPEVPGPPAVLEQAGHGSFYDHVRSLLADIEVNGQ